MPTAKENHPKTADAVIPPPILPPNPKAAPPKDLVGEIITITVRKMKITEDLQSIDTDLVRAVRQGRQDRRKEALYFLVLFRQSLLQSR